MLIRQVTSPSTTLSLFFLIHSRSPTFTPIGKPNPLFLTFDPVTKYPNGGHIYTTLNAVATSVGCKLNWLQLPPQGSMANDDYVTASVKLVDIFAAFYVTERFDYLVNGVTTTTMALSNMMILVTTTVPPEPSSWWTFGVPFSNNMWLCLLFVLVFQGFCQVAIIKRRGHAAGNDVVVVVVVAI